ncbi:EamA family transporter [bacterium]|nr:EamA family transporter [bacterium]
MPVKDLLIIITAILLGSIGQLFIKTGLNSFTSRFGSISLSTVWSKLPAIVSMPQIIIAIICFAISATFWCVVMSKRDLSQVYPFIALAHVFVVLMAYFVLKEQIGVLRIAGIAIIIIGVIVLAQDKVTSLG